MAFDVEDFGEKLKDLRIKKGLSTVQLGKILGVHHATISKWEKGIIKPSVDSIFEIAEFFNVRVGYLGGTEDQTR